METEIRQMMSHDKEIWITHTTGIYEGYSVSSHGRVVSHFVDTHKGGKYNWKPDYNYRRLMKEYTDNYKALVLNGQRKRVHVIVCNTFWGFTKNMEVDHIDRDKLNNVAWNLRWCTRRQNIHNTSLRTNNTSGYKGVNYCNKMKKWSASWYENGIRKRKSFEEKEDAINYRKKMEEEHYKPNYN